MACVVLDISLSADRLQALKAETVGDDRPGLGILEAEEQGIGAEQQSKRQGDGAQL